MTTKQPFFDEDMCAKLEKIKDDLEAKLGIRLKDGQAIKYILNHYKIE